MSYHDLRQSPGQFPLCSMAIALGRGQITHDAILSYIHSEFVTPNTTAQEEGRLGRRMGTDVASWKVL